MEGTALDAPVLAYLAGAAESQFTLVDIGCSGGIDAIWRCLGGRLRAIGFDPNLREIDRLRSSEANAGVRYVGAFVGLSPDHPFALRKGNRGPFSRNPWGRLSVAKSLEILRARELSVAEKTTANLWRDTELASASQTVVVPDYLREHGIASVDFVKMDIDGGDFDVLNSFDDALDGLAVLGLGLEVNFFGSDVDTEHTFHNTDRFMRARGYALFNLTVRRYSLAALPSRYVYSLPAQSEFGRPLQGDALYIRDLGDPENRVFADRLDPAKLVNLLSIFAAFKLPDCAAEIALRFRDRLADHCDVDRVLDLLAAQAQGSADTAVTYRQHMERFAANDPMFFPPAAEVSRPDKVATARGQAAFAHPDGLQDLLQCPETGGPIVKVDGAYISRNRPDITFPIEDGVVRAFVLHDGSGGDVMERIQAFYEEHPFPNYDGMDDLGSLIEKSVQRGFPEMLTRSIPPNTTVLEVGCGTGQLGNFLSIASRRVLSVDLCLNSLRLAHGFKVRNKLAGVTFAQMNLFRLPLRPSAFDVVICTGVLHHTSDPAGGFRGLVPLVKPGGHIVVGLYNRFGRLQTRARRMVAGVLGERVASIDPYLREYQITAEKRRAWFMDQYKNPHESLHTMDEVLGWFDASGVRFLRALPPTVFGRDFRLDYRTSLFEEDDRGTFPDRFVSQLHQMLTDKEGGLFLMIGRRDDPR